LVGASRECGKLLYSSQMEGLDASHLQGTVIKS
jgi:hypothetical protein